MDEEFYPLSAVRKLAQGEENCFLNDINSKFLIFVIFAFPLFGYGMCGAHCAALTAVTSEKSPFCAADVFSGVCSASKPNSSFCGMVRAMPSCLNRCVFL